MFQSTFNFQDIQLRVHIGNDKKELFHGADTCRALGKDRNHSRLIKTYVFQEYWIEVPNPNGGSPVLCLYEPGLYQLALNPIFDSDTARKFQRWIFEEVLPKLRASGYYIASDATSEQLEAAQVEIRQLKFELQSIRDKGAGISNLVELILENIQSKNTPQKYVSSNEWLNLRLQPMFPVNKFRSRFARNLSELYKSVYSRIPTKHAHQMWIENYNDYIDVKSNLYLIPLDLPILEHAFNTVVDWFTVENKVFMSDDNELIRTYPYAQ